MLDYTSSEHARIMWAWGEVKEWAEGQSGTMANDIAAMLKIERREPNADMITAMLCIMHEIRAALENRNQPIRPSELHMRPALIRVYTSVSWLIGDYMDTAKREKFNAERVRIMDIIQSALAIRAAAIDRMINFVGEPK